MLKYILHHLEMVVMNTYTCNSNMIVSAKKEANEFEEAALCIKNKHMQYKLALPAIFKVRSTAPGEEIHKIRPRRTAIVRRTPLSKILSFLRFKVPGIIFI